MTREEAAAVLESDAEYLYSQDEPYNMEAYRLAIQALKSEPRHGRWKGAGMGDYMCSLCAMVVSGNRYHYCPYCGARMQSTMGQLKPKGAVKEEVKDEASH